MKEAKRALAEIIAEADKIKAYTIGDKAFQVSQLLRYEPDETEEIKACLDELIDECEDAEKIELAEKARKVIKEIEAD